MYVTILTGNGMQLNMLKSSALCEINDVIEVVAITQYKRQK